MPEKKGLLVVVLTVVFFNIFLCAATISSIRLVDTYYGIYDSTGNLVEGSEDRQNICDSILRTYDATYTCGVTSISIPASTKLWQPDIQIRISVVQEPRLLVYSNDRLLYNLGIAQRSNTEG